MMENKVNRENPSQMAEGIAMQRFGESNKPEDERICYDPYAIHFIRPEIIEFGMKHPEEAKAKIEQTERQFLGLSSSIMARVRYFDDFLKKYIDEGLEQLVILGAGYDTRAYRIEKLKKSINVFEMDHPNTQSFKIDKIKEIFGSTPENVIYVPVDFEIENLGQKLFDNEYNSSKKTLFIMEGLIMYIPPRAVAETLSFIVENSCKGSAVIFDYYPKSVVDGTCKLKIGENIRNHLIQLGEPLQFGINEDEIEDFLTQFGFSNIKNVTSESYKKLYFPGKNENRDFCELLNFVHAVNE
ncbi:SAM-dependent methyltransferase [Methanobacterium oryzae]|uniref:SAM-dependent methyltransferase n=1 Tax=Methanobacterium oryzae TaxID=69540 RepID=UPI003D1CE4F8